ncbi:MAG: helix-turn-helix domain-containing protein [Planctomycetes bacterium]|nr:helix-turn-helix domain-containing protein [Planctomycetota bacterium]
MIDSSPHATKLLLTPPEAAKALAVSPRKLWQLTADKKIPSLKLGRLVRYPLADLTAWIDSQKSGGQQR